MVVLPILWTVSLAFQHVRLLNLRQHRLLRRLQPRQLHQRADLAGLRRRAGRRRWSTRSAARPARSASGWSRRWRCAGRSAAAGWCAPRMLLPYVAPVVAATFVWSTMLNPQFGIVNHYGTDAARLGRADRLPQLGASTISLFGVDLHVSHGAAHGGRSSRPGARSRSPSCSSPPGSQAIPERLEEAATGRRRHADPAVPPHRAAAAAADDRGADRAAVHLDLQQLRRHLPAHRRRRRAPRSSPSGSTTTSSPAATSAPPPPRRSCSPPSSPCWSASTSSSSGARRRWRDRHETADARSERRARASARPAAGRHRRRC